jgi:hypothetical protein
MSDRKTDLWRGAVNVLCYFARRASVAAGRRPRHPSKPQFALENMEAVRSNKERRYGAGHKTEQENLGGDGAG